MREAFGAWSRWLESFPLALIAISVYKYISLDIEECYKKSFEFV